MPKSEPKETLDDLTALLKLEMPGVIGEHQAIEDALFDIWETLIGSDNGGMKPEKLFGRMEDLTWTPPNLTFAIERHGATVNGSSYAELQYWEINTHQGTARIVNSRKRQVGRRQKPLDVKALAAEIIELISHNANDPRFIWLEPYKCIQLVMKNLIPDDCAQQTVAGRRKRFSQIFEPQILELGWSRVPKGNLYVYEKIYKLE